MTGRPEELPVDSDVAFRGIATDRERSFGNRRWIGRARRRRRRAADRIENGFARAEFAEGAKIVFIGREIDSSGLDQGNSLRLRSHTVLHESDQTLYIGERELLLRGERPRERQSKKTGS